MVFIHEKNGTETAEEAINEAASPEYKEVVIIGAGPSGITLSYFLAGNWPYYNGLGESINEMLHYRLNYQISKSIIEQDLEFLSQGLEGRSGNQVALLFDILNHPQADLGMEMPSLLNWKHRKDKEISHIVIGKGQYPGGSWMEMDGNLLTISLGCWMELPQLNFREWQASVEARLGRNSRASVKSVAEYYCDYVQVHHLQKYFLGNSIITEVVDISQDKDSLPENSCDIFSQKKSSIVRKGDPSFFLSRRRHTISEIPVNSYAQEDQKQSKKSRPLWQVKGYTLTDDANIVKPFTYITKNVVLANGASNPNLLNIPGENFPFVLHSLNDLEDKILSGHLNQNSDSVVIVGAGLSAADAIIASRFYSVSVVHIFRRSVTDSKLIFRQLPENMYPEYHKVYQMMKNPEGYEGYKAFEEHSVLEILPDKTIKISDTNYPEIQIIKASYIVVCIGSHPDLSFLSLPIQRNLGIYSERPIDCKNNPILIDCTTHETVKQPGLYAMGPLVGENFVRFLQGGALAITNFLTKMLQKT